MVMSSLLQEKGDGSSVKGFASCRLLKGALGRLKLEGKSSDAFQHLLGVVGGEGNLSVYSVPRALFISFCEHPIYQVPPFGST